MKPNKPTTLVIVACITPITILSFFILQDYIYTHEERNDWSTALSSDSHFNKNRYYTEWKKHPGYAIVHRSISDESASGDSLLYYAKLAIKDCRREFSSAYYSQDIHGYEPVLAYENRTSINYASSYPVKPIWIVFIIHSMNVGDVDVTVDASLHKKRLGIVVSAKDVFSKDVPIESIVKSAFVDWQPTARGSIGHKLVEYPIIERFESLR